MNPALDLARDLRQALIQARLRTKDPHLAQQVAKGRFRLVRVVRDQVEILGPWRSPSGHLAALRSL